jgi:hypothetical protein
MFSSISVFVIAFLAIVGFASADSNCLQWVLGFSGDSCTETCAAISKTCNLPTMQTVTTQGSFDSMVASASQRGKDPLPGSTAAFCTGGVNGWPFATAPAAMQYPLYIKGEGANDVGEYIMTTSCFFPANGEQSDCDTKFQVPVAQRFCACDSETC